MSVAVPVPALGLLTYRVPDDQPMPAAGARVVVPIGPRTLTGVVLGEAAAADTAYTIKPIKRVVDDHAFVPPDVIKLTQWVSEYYLAGPGATLAAALPPHGLTARTDRFKTVRDRGADRRRPRRRRAPGGAQREAPGSRARPAPAPTRRRTPRPAAGRGAASADRRGRRTDGARAGRARHCRRGVDAAQGPGPGGDPGRARRSRSVRARGVGDPPARPIARPTDEQQAALDQLLPLAAARAFHVALIHGVTGSGKTEVYLRLADAVRRAGRGVLMLVPEIALTPQVAALFRARFGQSVAIQHSGLSDGERHDQWHRIRRGDVDVVIGTRSAVFAPLANPGLIIVDEEHDTSYKQDETPRYHGRDVAIMRGKFADALVVIGSATPTIESYANALDGKYTLVTMNKRVLDRPLASVSVVNMRDEIAAAGEDVVLSRPLRRRHRRPARSAASSR